MIWLKLEEREIGILGDDGFGFLVLRPASEADVVKIFGATNIAPVTVGNSIRATGFGGQFRTQYEVLPRFHERAFGKSRGPRIRAEERA